MQHEGRHRGDRVPDGVIENTRSAQGDSQELKRGSIIDALPSTPQPINNIPTVPGPVTPAPVQNVAMPMQDVAPATIAPPAPTE